MNGGCVAYIFWHLHHIWLPLIVGYLRWLLVDTFGLRRQRSGERFKHSNRHTFNDNGPASPARPRSGRSTATSRSPYLDAVKSPRSAPPSSPGSSMATSKSPYKDAIMSPAASRSAPRYIANVNTSVSRAGRTRKKTAKARQHEEEYRNNLSSPGIAKKRGRR